MAAMRSMLALMPIISPTSMKAMVTDKSVRIARAGLRIQAAQTSGKYFIF